MPRATALRRSPWRCRTTAPARPSTPMISLDCLRTPSVTVRARGPLLELFVGILLLLLRVVVGGFRTLAHCARPAPPGRTPTSTRLEPDPIESPNATSITRRFASGAEAPSADSRHRCRVARGGADQRGA